MAGGLLSCGMRTLRCGMHVGSSSLSRDWSRAPCLGSVESYPLHHQGSPKAGKFEFDFKGWVEYWQRVTGTEWSRASQPRDRSWGLITVSVWRSTSPFGVMETVLSFSPSLAFGTSMVSMTSFFLTKEDWRLKDFFSLKYDLGRFNHGNTCYTIYKPWLKKKNYSPTRLTSAASPPLASFLSDKRETCLSPSFQVLGQIVFPLWNTWLIYCFA